jgi:hypothetical protein
MNPASGLRPSAGLHKNERGDMFDKILIANRGDQPHGGAATQSHRMVREADSGDFAAEGHHV